MNIDSESDSPTEREKFEERREMIDNQIPNRSDFSSNEEWLYARILYWKRELNTALAEITELRAELENMRKLATL